MTRYITEFRWVRPPGLPPTEWRTPEAALAESLDEVAALISEYADEKPGAVRVTQISDDVPPRDVTEDAVLHFANRELDRTDEWPWYLDEIKPAYLKDDAA